MNWVSKMLWGQGEDGLRRPASWEEWIAAADSPSGYVRQSAVEALALSGHGAALPVLLARANDWVPEVRGAARKAIGAFLFDEHAAAWAVALGEVSALRRAARDDHSPLLRSIEDFLARPGPLSVLKAALPRMHREGIRVVFGLELRAATGDDEATHRILLRAVSYPDVKVAEQGMAGLDALGSAARRLEIAIAGCVSEFSVVRAAGLRAALRSGLPPGPALLRSLCRDPNSTVRSLALAALGADDRAQVQADAAQAFGRGQGARLRTVALEVLCVLLDRPDALALCERASVDPVVGVRRAAHAGRFALAPAQDRDALVELTLRDSSPRVRGVAVAQVKKGATAPPLAMLLTTFRSVPGSLDSLATVAVHLSPWDRLDFLLTAWYDTGGGGPSQRRLVRELNDWEADMLRCFVSPSPAAVRMITHAWGLSRDGLPSDLQRRLAFHLRSFGVLGDKP